MASHPQANSKNNSTIPSPLDRCQTWRVVTKDNDIHEWWEHCWINIRIDLHMVIQHWSATNGVIEEVLVLIRRLVKRGNYNVCHDFICILELSSPVLCLFVSRVCFGIISTTIYLIYQKDTSKCMFTSLFISYTLLSYLYRIISIHVKTSRLEQNGSLNAGMEKYFWHFWKIIFQSKCGNDKKSKWVSKLIIPR